MTIQVGKVGMVDINDIKVGDRAREVTGNLDELENNLKETGLISPLAVEDLGDGKYLLLAGERRLTVMKRNDVSSVPVRIYEHGLSELEIKNIELAENFYRKDFEYWELDSLMREIHSLQQQLHGVKPPGPSDQGWGTRDTAAMVGAKSPASVTEAIKRAEAREVYPELFATCKSASDASKVLKKVGEMAIRQQIAQKIELQKCEGSLQQLSNCFIVGDFFKGVEGIPDGSIHLVEIDPPYAIDLARQKKKDGVSQYMLDEYNEIPANQYKDFLSRTFKECYRVMAQHSWLLCWFAPEPHFTMVYQELLNAGFGTTRMCGIWTKGIPGQSMNPSIRLANSYEMFFYAWKGQPALNKAGKGNEFRCSPVLSNQKTHPTERPVELMKDIYDTFAFPGSRVLIPFLGSGSGLIAAYELGLSGVGFELSKSCKDSFLVRVHLMK